MPPMTAQEKEMHEESKLLQTSAAIPAVPNKHTTLQSAIDNSRSVNTELKHLIDSIQGSDSDKEPTSEQPNACLAEVLDSGAKQIEDLTQDCRDCIGRIRELLFG